MRGFAGTGGNPTGTSGRGGAAGSATIPPSSTTGSAEPTGSRSLALLLPRPHAASATITANSARRFTGAAYIMGTSYNVIDEIVVDAELVANPTLSIVTGPATPLITMASTFVP